MSVSFPSLYVSPFASVELYHLLLSKMFIWELCSSNLVQISHFHTVLQMWSLQVCGSPGALCTLQDLQHRTERAHLVVCICLDRCAFFPYLCPPHCTAEFFVCVGTFGNMCLLIELNSLGAKRVTSIVPEQPELDSIYMAPNKARFGNFSGH